MANAQTAELILKLIDEVSGPAGKISTALNTLNTRLKGGVDPTTGGTKGQTPGQFWVKEGQRLRAATSQINSLSIPTAIGAAWGAKTVYSIEDKLNELEGRVFGADKTLTIAPGVEMDKATWRKDLTEQINKLNADLPLNAIDILGATKGLVTAGLSWPQVMGALPASLDYSVAGDVEPLKAVQDLTSMVSQFGLPMSTQAEVNASILRMSDLIAFAANKSKTDVNDLAESFKYAGPLAANLGISPERMAAMFAAMADKGVRGSEAGVAIRSGIVRMIRPTKMAVSALDQYGIDLGDYVTGSKPTTAADIGSAFKSAGMDVSGITDAIASVLASDLKSTDQRDKLTSLITTKLGDKSILGADTISEILNDVLFHNTDNLDIDKLITDMQNAHISAADMARIFDVRQGSRMLGLFDTDINAWLEKITGPGEKGFSKNLRETRNQGIVGSWQRFDASLVDLVEKIASSGVLDDATGMINGLTRLIDKLGEVNPALLKVVTYTALAVAVLGPLGMALKGLAALFVILATPLRWAAALAGVGTTGAVEAAGATGTAAVAEATAGAIMGKLATVGVGAAGAYLMSTTSVNGGEDKYVNDNLRTFHGPEGPQHHSPGGWLRKLKSYDKAIDFDPMASQYAGPAGEKAGTAMGQGIAQGVQAQTPNVLAQLLIMLGMVQTAANKGIQVPVVLNGGGISSGGGVKPQAARNRPAGTTKVSIVNHIHGATDPHKVAEVVTASLDKKLQRSRELSMEDRVSYA